MSPHTMLLVRSGQRVCAVPVRQVVETLRPLAVSPLAGTESFVKGATVVRGEPLPVVDLDAFLGGREPAPVERFVVVRCGDRRAVLAVQGVLGVTELDAAGAPSVPLLAAAARGAIEAIASRDRELLLLLDASRTVPENAWRAVHDLGRGA